MTTILPSQDCVTLINTFHVEPERTEALLQLLIDATEDTMRFVPGFISANLHLSLDRRRVVNYAQWRSPAAFKAMLALPQALAHMKKAKALALSFDPVLYQLCHSDDRAPQEGHRP